MSSTSSGTGNGTGTPPVTGRFTGRIALVTGGARGVGRAIVTMLAERGAHVVVNCFHSYEEGKRLHATLIQRGHRADLIRASVARPDQVDRMFDEIADRHGRLDILVNNAASGWLGPAADATAQHFGRAFDTNVLGSFWCARRAADLMPAGGSIVNLSSVGATLAVENYVAVGTSKAALEALTRNLAVEYAPRGIRVNTASCSLIDGDVASLFPRADEVREVIRSATPMGRIATAEDLARVVLFLAGEDSEFITGQTVVADGGLSLGSVMLSPPRAPVTRQVASAAGPASVSVSAATPASAAVPADDPIAVVGMGLVVPGASNPEEFWRLRLSGRPVFVDVPAGRWRVESFHDPDPAAPDKTYSRRSGFITDAVPGAREGEEYTTGWLRYAAGQALDGVRRAAGDRFSCFVGYTADGSQHLEEALILAGLRRRLDALGDSDETAAVRVRLEAHLHRGGTEPSRFLPHEVGRRAMAGLLPAETDVVMVDTACSSSLYSVDLGIKALRLGECDVAVCGGAFALGPRGAVLFSKLGGLSRSGQVRSLDRSGDGVLFSDGAGAVVLKRLSRALADGDQVHGLLPAAGTSSDGKGKAIYAPNAGGQAIAVRRALAAPGVDPSRVDWVAAHATGTPAGDLAELTGLATALPADRPIRVTSNKSLIGHAGWAAGVASLIEVLLGLRHETIPPQLGFEAPPDGFDAAASALDIPTDPVPWPARADRPRCATVSSFGFGGTNAHLVVEEYVPSASGSVAAVPQRPADRIAVVGWTAHLPGLADHDDVLGWLRGEGSAPEASFGDVYPAPSIRRIKLPGQTVRTLDRCQLMVLECVARLEPVLGEFWRGHRDTTGVFAGHMGPTRHGTLYALRCQLDDLRRVLGEDARPGSPAARLLAGLAADLERLLPPANEDSFPGIMPNVIPARVANYHDFHGLNMTVDTGLTSTRSALEVAARYLRAGDLDLALVFGIHGNSTGELADVVAPLLPGRRRIGEGVGVFGLVRAATADEHGLSVLGYLDGLLDGLDDADDVTPGALTHLGADGAIRLARALAAPAPTAPATATAPAATTAAAPTTVAAAPTTMAPPTLDVARYVVRLHPLPLVPVRPPADLWPAGAVLLTDQPELLGDLDLSGVTVLSTAPVPADRPAWVHMPDPSVESVAAALPDAAAVRHLRVVTDLGRAAEPARPWDVSPALVALHDLTFLTLQRGYERIADGGSVLLLALSGRGQGTWHPYAGLFTGLVKSLHIELPDAFVLAVVPSSGDVAAGLRRLRDETSAHHFLPVIAYDGDVRSAQLADGPDEDPADSGPPPLNRTSVVVACGGARGITAEVLKELARTARPVIYVLGTNAIDDWPAELLAQSDEEFAAGRPAFLRAETARRPDVPIARLHAEYDLVGNARAARRTLAELAAHSGSGRVHYLRCDVRDAADVAAAMDHVLGREGGIDLLLNAAGTNRAGSVPMKKLADFRLVRDIKLRSYQNLKRALQDRPPRIWCNFGSFIGFVGQTGEVDYAPANDFLSTAAAWASEAAGRTEFTIGWTRWRDVGVGANPLVRAWVEARKDTTSMGTAEGVYHFMHEIGRRRHEPMPVHLGELERRSIEAYLPGFFAVRDDDHRAADPRSGRFYLGTTRRGRRRELWSERVFDLSRDAYLAHHVVHGRPTLPGTFVPEIAAEAAMELVPGRVPVVFEDSRFEAFLRVYGDRPAVKRIHARVVAETDGETEVAVRIVTDVRAPDGTLLAADRLHFATTVRMRDEPPPAPWWEPWPDEEDEDPVVDPYHVPNPAVHLTGPFVSTTGTRRHPLGRRALVALRVERDDEVFSRFVVPGILLDGLARTCVLDPRPGGWVPLVAPARIRRIDLYEPRNDVELAAAYPEIQLYSLPRAIDLTAAGPGRRPDNRCVAATSDGRVLLQLKDVVGVILGYVHPGGEFRSPEAWARAAAPAGSSRAAPPPAASSVPMAVGGG
jgi:NAD(P)-dependent dehydrogenase (short-subunit alcohol dehydrogenase family)/3-oxoacyl-(acyl-carrier-protein) synthase